MCGIIGFSGDVAGCWKETHRVLEAMFLAAESRGKDATGFAAVTGRSKSSGSRVLVYAKEPVPASQFVQSESWKALRNRRCVAMIGHVRWQTHGDAKDPVNNHPHMGQRGLALVHNGILTNHLQVAADLKLQLTSQCDSEVLLRLVEQYASPVLGLKACLEHCRGSMAVALLESERGQIHLVRNANRPLWMAKLRNDDRWWFASTPSILVTALVRSFGKTRLGDLGQLLPLADNVVHSLLPSGLLLADFPSVKLA